MAKPQFSQSKPTLQQITIPKTLQKQSATQVADCIETTRDEYNTVRSAVPFIAQPATKPTEPVCITHQQYNENEIVFDINSGRAPLRKKPSKGSMQYRLAVHPLPPSRIKKNTQMLQSWGSDSDVLEKNKASSVTTGRSNISKHPKQRLNDNYHEHTIVQRGYFRGRSSVVKQRPSLLT